MVGYCYQNTSKNVYDATSTLNKFNLIAERAQKKKWILQYKVRKAKDGLDWPFLFSYVVFTQQVHTRKNKIKLYQPKIVSTIVSEEENAEKKAK